MNLVISEKKLIKMGKELVLDLFNMFDDEFYKEHLTNEIKQVEKDFYKYFTNNFYNRDLQDWKSVDLDNIVNPDIESEVKSIKRFVKHDTLDIKDIFKTLRDLEFDIDLNEEFSFKKDAFLRIYEVFDCDYKYLE